MTKRPSTPFPTTGYYGEAYFCDRQEELKRLIDNLQGDASTTLVALRRMGKTALIKHLQHVLADRYFSLYVDILPTESLADFLNHLATSVAAMSSENTNLGKRIWKFLKSLRPTVSYDTLSGNPVLSFNLNQEEGLTSVGEIFDFLESQNKPVLIAIDEFQQILKYPERNVDAWLRSKIQELNNVIFIFSGSQQHLIQEMFVDPTRPFFRSTQFMHISKIGRESYHRFIAEKFSENSKKIEDRTIDSILDWADGYTYYVQLLCNRTFLSSGRTVAREAWKEEAIKLLKEQEFVFYAYREVLTNPQWNLLKAIAREGGTRTPTASDFIARNSLGNPSTVLQSLHTLQKKEMIYRETGQDGKSYYGVYDLLFRRWIE
jgi:AAA+ ATPase superfamily predicted ATPase